MPSGTTIGIVTIIVLLGIVLSVVSSIYVVTSSNLSSANKAVTSEQSEISFMQANPSTSTVTATLMSTVTLTQTSTETYTTTSTQTTTTSLYPPSNSSYALTFISGNTTQNVQGCGLTLYNVWLTFEAHSQLPSGGVLLWVRFNDGTIASSSPSIFPNQAYVSFTAQVSHSYSACGQTNAITSVNIWITDESNNVLSPTENMSIAGS